MLLKISDLKGEPSELSEPQILGNYSIDGERCFCNDISQMKYYKQPSNPEKVKFDLDDDLHRICKSEDINMKLDFMLQWVSENFDRLKVQDSENSSDRWLVTCFKVAEVYYPIYPIECYFNFTQTFYLKKKQSRHRTAYVIRVTYVRLEPDVICYRGILTNIFLTPFNNRDGWIICASKFKGTIYLCGFETYEAKQQRLRRNTYTKKCLAWGHKFEQYMLSDTPSTDPDLTIPLNENEEFCCIFKSKLGETNLLYGAEIDGICSQQQIRDTLVGKKVELIELKTMPLRAVNYRGQIDPKRALITLKWWCQSYLVGIQRIISGCKKDNSGIVAKIKEFKCDELGNCLENSLSPTVCKGFGNKFLMQMKNIVRKDYDKCLYKFMYNPGTDYITVEEMKPNPKSEYTFLHFWYIEKAKQRFEECR